MGASTERWVAWMGSDGVGLGMYAPTGSQAASQDDEFFTFGRLAPPGTTATNFIQHWVSRPTPPGGQFSLRVFLIAGTLDEIRKAVYELEGHPAQLSAGPASVVEGNSGTVSMQFPVTLSPPWPVPVTVSYATANQTATAGTDYTPVSGTLTFGPGETSRQITVSVTPDSLHEGNETFLMQFSNAGGATPPEAQTVGTITNDDPSPVMSLASASLVEGNAGSATLAFNATLSAPSGLALTATFASANGTAAAGSDYDPVSGAVTFPAGTLSRSISVPVRGDVLDEYDETFFVDLANYSAIGQGRGTGTIQDDDPAPSISISDVSHQETNSGTAPATFQVGLSAVRSRK